MVHRHGSKRKNKLLKILRTSRQELDHTIQDGVNSKNVSYWYGLNFLVILGISAGSTFTITLIPQSNQIEFQNHWYELALITPVLPFLLTSIMILDSYYYFKIHSMVSIQSFLQIFVPGSLAGILSYSVMVMIWTSGLGYKLPIPFVGSLWFPISGLFTVSLWFEFPKRLRKNRIYRKRILFYITALAWIFLTIAQYDCLIMLPSDFQWFLSIILPALWTINIWIIDNIIYKVVPYDCQEAKICNLAFIRSIHTTYVAIILANVTECVLYSILGIEFFVQIYSCYEIVRLHRKSNVEGQNNETKKKINIQNVLELVLSETIDVVASSAYAITLAAAYYGPNATILGNIRNSYWTFKGIQDIEKTLTAVFQIAAIDLGIGAICGLVLWNCCKINLLQEFCKLMKTYWLVIAVRIAIVMSRVSLNLVYLLYRVGFKHQIINEMIIINHIFYSTMLCF